MRIAGILVVLLLLVGCTTASTTTSTGPTPVAVAAPPPTAVIVTPQGAPAGRYSGMAWTWDTERNIVTLYDYGTAKTIRVLTTPDQIARLRLHESATVTGQLLAPDNIGTVVVMGGPMNAVPNGPASTTEISGQVTAIDSNGVASIESARGPIRVWVADGAQSRFSAGRPVKVHVSVQPVRMVAVSGAGGQASPTMAVSPSIPGDSAVAVGRVLGVTPNGALAIESSRGPISVWVPDAVNFRVGDFVQVNTVVSN